MRTVLLALAICGALCGTASAIPHAVYDIVVYDAATKKVLRVPVFHMRRNPNGIEFKRIMLREKKRLKPGEALGYTHEGSFLPGDTWQGIRTTLTEPNPLPLSTPLDPNYAPPPSFGGGD